MKILFLSHYFPPEVNAPATRTYEHCKCWVESGHEVTVVTCAPNHPKGNVYPGYKNKLFQKETVKGINVIRLWTYVTANEGFLKRTANYVSYMISVFFAISFLAKHDVVISTSPQFFNGLAGYLVSRLKRIPWVLEIRDLWPESILAVGAITNRHLIRILEYLELFAYSKAHRIVPVTDAFKQYMIGKGIDKNKIEVIKNGVDLSFFQPLDTDIAFARKLGVEGKFVVAYVGTHGMAHHLETILEAARLTTNKDIIYLMVGDGAEREKLLSKKNELELTNVVMIKQLPKEQMPLLWSVSHVSLVLLKKSDLFKAVIPSKIFESMAMKKPIVTGVEGESLDIVLAAKAGIGIEPENAKELVAACESLFDKAELAAELGANGRRHVADFFDRGKLAQRYENLLTSLCKA